YTSEDAEVRGRQATLARLQERLSVVESSLVDPQAGSDYGPLADLYGRLSRRVAVSAALLEILSASTDPQLRDVASSFLLAIEDYESEPTSQNMEAVRNGFDDLRRLAPDGAVALTDAM